MLNFFQCSKVSVNVQFLFLTKKSSGSQYFCHFLSHYCNLLHKRCSLAGCPDNCPRGILPPPPIRAKVWVRGRHRKDIDKKVTETNQRLQNYCRQKDINYIKNANFNEDCLAIFRPFSTEKALPKYLNRKGNSCFAKNI